MTTGAGQRRAGRPGEFDLPRERDGAVVRLRSFGLARQVLRARNATTQAGFTAEAIPTGYLQHHPILMADGPKHDEQRKKVAQFFAPAVVTRRYAPIAERSSRVLLDEAAAAGSCLLGDLALEFTVEVTAEAVGLTESAVPAMARRLVTFFNQPPSTSQSQT